MDTQALLNGMQPQQYVAMLTAENAKELLGLVGVGQNAMLLDVKAIMAAAVEAVVQAENKLHSSVTATAAAAAIHVSHVQKIYRSTPQQLQEEDISPGLDSRNICYLVSNKPVCLLAGEDYLLLSR